jgi:hypothetical protein
MVTLSILQRPAIMAEKFKLDSESDGNDSIAH